MSKKLLLGVNVDHVATLRQVRGTSYPDPVEVALLAEKAGADYITMHLREDRRHIQADDVLRLKQLQTTYLNLEVAITDEMLDFAVDVSPQDCCLVPEKREELTTEGGLDVANQLDLVKKAVDKLHKANIRVSLFIDTDIDQIQAAADSGAKVVEFHTGHYADAPAEDKERYLNNLTDGFALADKLGLLVNAGHGLTVENVSSVAQIEYVKELNIGHSIVARSVMVGIEQAVSEIREAMGLGFVN